MRNRETLDAPGLTIHAVALAAVVATSGLTGTVALAAPIPVADGEVVVEENGLCSLREAILNANFDLPIHTDCEAGSGPDVLELPADSMYVLPDEDELDSGLPAFVTEIVIDGNGSTIERDGGLECDLDGNQAPGEFRLISIDGPAVVTLNQLVLQNGCADGSSSNNDGGAILISSGSLTLDEVVVVDNMAFDKSGGLDTSLGPDEATVTIVDSRFSSNFALGGGGAIGNGDVTTMTIVGSTISNNSAEGDGGGGIGNFGDLRIVNSTISGNTDDSSTGGGGGIGNLGELELTASTVTGNGSTGTLGGGGIGNAGVVEVKNSIVGDNTAGGDCVHLAGSFNAEGVNFDTDGTCAILDGDFTQVTSGQLALGPLADNGGATPTHALLAGSVALDAAADCTLLDGSTPVTEDQRGVTRPQGTACDVGAFEAVEEAVSVLEIPTASGWGLLLLALALAGAALPMLRR